MGGADRYSYDIRYELTAPDFWYRRAFHSNAYQWLFAAEHLGRAFADLAEEIMPAFKGDPMALAQV